MKLNKLTARNLVRMFGYKGVCNNCSGSVEYDDELIGIELFEDAQVNIVVPIDVFECPHCREPILNMRIWKSLDISSELAQIKKNL